MIVQIGIDDFKSYLSAQLKLSPLTVLIGANASGKSNAIEALRLLSWVVQGNRLSSIRYAAFSGEDSAIRGTVGTMSRRGTDTFTIKARLSDSDWNRFTLSIQRTSDDELHIVNERIVGHESAAPLYEVVGGHGGIGNDLRVAYNNFARGGKKPQVTCTDQMAILLQMQSGARFEIGHKAAQTQIPRICARFQDALGSILFLDPQPALMRSYSFKSEHRLRGDGANLSGVLWNICQAEGGREKILEIIRSLPEQDISGLDFIETPRGEVMLSLEETFGTEREQFDATLLSDGTLRVLSIAAAIFTAQEGSLVVIEEIDNGVHPSRAGMLLNAISNIAKSRNLSVLISSHNPALLDAVPNDAVPNVVFCYRDLNNGSSKLVRLSDMPNYPELIARGTVGHLLTAGLIERFVKYHPGPEAKRARSREWLASMRSGAI